MGLTGLMVRVSVPSATLYWTCKEGLWDASVGSPQSTQNFLQQKTLLDSWVSKGISVVQPYAHPAVEEIKKLRKQLTGVRCLYNSGVKRSFAAISSFDPSHESQRLYSWIKRQLMENEGKK